MGKRLDVTGQKFGKLHVLNFSHIDKFKRANFVCICECGNTFTTTGHRLRNGTSTSCGCWGKERIAEFNTGDGLSSARGLYGGYKRAAIKRGFEFIIDFDTFVEITSKNCVYCGQSPKQTHQHTNCTNIYTYNGIDRFINSEGYTLENSVSCCGVCNIAKGTMNGAEFKEWIRKVYSHYASN